jgi:hypothetical protein
MLKRIQMEKGNVHKIVAKIIKHLQGIMVDNLKEI